MFFKKSYIHSWLLAASLFCLAPAVFADCPTTSAPSSTTACMYLMDPGSIGGFNGVYVGPYTASINDGTPTPVICDDFLDESFVPEYWTADIYSGSSPFATASTSTAMQKQSGLTGTPLAQAYDEVGYLALKLLGASDPTIVGEIHFALWSVFDPAALATLDPAYGVTSTTPNQYYSAAQGFLTEAASQVGKDNASNYSSYISQFTIYSPDTNYQICVGSTTVCTEQSEPQEFLVHTPEPPFLALLGMDLSGLGALVYLLHRRRSSRP
jgi:hypothetical protein